MRKLARILPYLALFLVALIAAVSVWRGGPLAEQLRTIVVQELSRALGREVSVGSASLAPSGRLVLEDVEVRDSDGVVLLSVTKAIARVGRQGDRLGFLTRPTEVSEVTLVQPQLRLVRAEDGALNVSDLISRQREEPSRFQGKVVIQDGALVFVDEARGGVVTTVREVDLGIRYPRPGEAIFALSARGGEGEFEELKANGSWGGEDADSRVQASVSRLDLAYALARAPETAAFDFPAGVADVTAEIAPGAADASGGPTYSFQAEVRGATVTFPWLLRPLEQVSGNLRFARGDLRLDGMSGRVVGAPIAARGVIADLGDPRLDLRLQISDLHYRQLRTLLPALALPAGLNLSGPMQVSARVEGPASDVAVSGDASVEALTFRAIPWHDLTADFRYHRGRLKIEGLRAHGSPRRLAADLELALEQPLSEAEGSLELIGVPLSLFAQMAGLDSAGLDGTASLSVSGRFDGDLHFEGDVAVEDLSWRGLSLGAASGRLALSDGTLALTQGRLEGVTATGQFEGQIAAGESFDLTLALSSLDLSAVGQALGLRALTGRSPASAEVSGRLDEGNISAQFALGPGEASSRSFDEITGALDITPQGLRVRDLAIRSGESRCSGGLEVSGWRGPRDRAALAGRFIFTGLRPADLLPPAVAALPDVGALDGVLILDGTLAEPQAELTASLLVANSNGPQYELGRAALRYEGRRIVVDELVLDDGRSHVSIVGDYRPGADLSLDLVGDPVDLASLTPWLKQRYGLALAGRMRVEATARGEPANPVVQFDARAPAVDLNQAVLEGLHLSGSLTDGRLRVASSGVRHAGGALSLSGDVELASGEMDLMLNLAQIDLGATLLLYDTAIYRLSRLAMPVAHLSSYTVIPARIRPLGGKLTGNLHLTGRARALRTAGDLSLEGVSFAGREIDRVEGDLDITLQTGAGGELSIGEGSLSLEASHETALASVRGEVSPEGEVFLTADLGNLDLGLLVPWLRRGSDNGKTPPLSIGGQAAINFDVTGTMAEPVLRGDVFVDELHVGALRFEAADASPISLARGLLSIEQLRLRNGPMEGQGQASFPMGSSRQEERDTPSEPSAELHIRNAEFAPIPGMSPVIFDADLYLEGNRLVLGRRPTGEPDEDHPAGIRGSLGSGAIRAGGEVELRNLSLSRLAENEYDVSCELDDIELLVPDLVSAKLRGRLLLNNAGEGGQPLLATPEGEPLVLFDAVFGVPEHLPRVAGGLAFPFAPALAVDILAGENIWFRHGRRGRPTEIEVEPGAIISREERTGYLHLGGLLSPAGLTLDGHAAARTGQLAFPNGLLRLRSGEVRISRAAEELRVTVAGAEADGRVGDYYVSLRPTGRLYPPADAAELALGTRPFRLNAVTVPSLEEGFALTLLMGPVAAPTRGARREMTGLFAPPGSPSQATGEITGIMLAPIGGAGGTPRVALDFSFRGQLRLRLAERLFRRLFVSYISPVGGPTETSTLRLTYEVTPLWSLGWSVNELERSRWEVQAFVPF